MTSKTKKNLPTGNEEDELPSLIESKRKPEVNKDGGWGWMVVLGSCICQFFLIGINRSMGIVYILLQERFNTTQKETALVASIFVSFRALGGPLASKLCDRFGCRRVTVVGGVFLCVGLALSSFALNLVHIYITFGVVAGFGGVLVFSPSYIAVSEWFDKKKGKAMSFSTLGTGFGSIVMAPTVTALVTHYGYFGTMLIAGALMLHTSVGGALYRKPGQKHVGSEVIELVVVDEKVQAKSLDETQTDDQANKETDSSWTKGEDIANLNDKDGVLESGKEMEQHNGNHHAELGKTSDISSTSVPHSQTPDETSTKIPESNKPSRSPNESTPSVEEKPKRHRRLLSCFRSTLWRNIPLHLYCLMIVATQGCIQLVLIFLPGRGRELGASREQASLLLTIFGASDMVGRFVFGFVFDVKFFRSRRTHLYVCVAASFAVSAIVLGYMPSYVSLVFATVLVAFFEGGAHSQRATNVTDLVEKSQMSLGVGLVIFSQGVGNFYGPLVGGALKDLTQSFASCFLFGGATLLGACILTIVHDVVRYRSSLKAKKKKKKKNDDVIKDEQKLTSAS